MNAPGDDAPIGITGARYEGFDLATKYGWMQQGQGANAVAPGGDYLSQMAQDYGQSDTNIRTQLARLGVSWTGQASQAASAGLTQLADYAQSANQTSTAGSASLGQYGESFAELKPKVPKPVEVGQQSWGGRILDGAMGVADGAFGIQSDYRARLRQYQRQDAQANQALYAHQRNTQSVLDGFKAGDPVPTVAASGSDAGPGGGGRGRGPGGGGGGGASPPGGGTAPGAAGGDPSGGTSPTTAATAAPPPTAPDASTGRPPGGLGSGSRPGGAGGSGSGGSLTNPSSALPALPAQDSDPTFGPGGPGGTGGPGRSRRLGPDRPSYQPPQARNLEQVPRSAITEALLGPELDGNAGRSPGGLPAGMPGIGAAGGAGRDQEREHRNNVYLPSDEPFLVEFEEYVDYTPPVIGLDTDTP
jgi:hypothetical protein